MDRYHSFQRKCVPEKLWNVGHHSYSNDPGEAGNEKQKRARHGMGKWWWYVVAMETTVIIMITESVECFSPQKKNTHGK